MFSKIKGLFSKSEYIWILRILTLLILFWVIRENMVLPRESDSLFAINKQDVDPDLSDVSYKGDFVRVLASGERVPVIIPGKNEAKKGEVFVIESVIPSDFDEDYIITRSSHQDVKIYVDDELRVNYTTKYTRPTGTESANRYIFCRTSSKDAGKVLRIETVTTVKAESGTASAVYCGSKFDFWIHIFKEFGSDLIFGLLIIVLGVFVIGTSIALTMAYKRKFELEYIGWCVLYIGLWLVSDSKLRQLIVLNVSSLSNLTFLVIILAPLPLSMCVDTMQKHRYHKAYQIVCVLAWIDFIVSASLEIFRIANFVEFLSAAHVILVVTFLLIVATMLSDWKKGYIAEYKTIVIGLVMLILSVSFEIVAVYFVDIISGVSLTIGAFIFIGSAGVKTIADIIRDESEKQNRRLEEQKRQAEAVSMQMIKTLSDTLEAKDEYTKGHSHRVAEYSVIIAKGLGMNAEEQARLHYAASLHDIGKIGIPDTILNKPSRLTDQEYAIIKTHTVIGADILKKIEIISYVEQVARYHHERFDGRGYPEGLAGVAIPYEARIVALADSYDAMNSKRVYRSPVSKNVIRDEIEKNKGTQFDPQMAEVFLRLFDEGAFDIDETVSEYQDGIEANEEANKILSLLVDTINTRQNADDIDFLTGLPMRNRGENIIREVMQKKAGALMFIDMDNLKKINDIHGHQSGDKALKLLGKAIAAVAKYGVASRIGGDEFILYLPESNEEKVIAIAEAIVDDFNENKNLDPQIEIASLSIGISISNPGEKFEAVMLRADKALYHVKHTGKDGVHLFTEELNLFSRGNTHVDMDKLVDTIKNVSKYEGAMELENREFAKMYGYIANLCERYNYNCQIVLITNEVMPGEIVSIDEIEKSMKYMEIAIKDAIRTVDVCTRHSSVQFLVILLEAKKENVEVIVNRIFSQFHKMFNESWLTPTYETKSMLDQNEES